MSREFKPEVTDEMVELVAKRLCMRHGCTVAVCEFHFRAAADALSEALPLIRAQLHKWAAEEMRGLVPENGSPLLDVQAQVWWNACRAETLANIEAWEKGHE